MQVTFTKGPGISYTVAVERDKGPALAPRGGPGGHPYLPHDLVHLLVEAEAGLRGGVFGRLAAGDNGMFWPADPAQRRKAGRRRKAKGDRHTPQEHADMGRSEELAGIALPLWELRRGHIEELPAYLATLPESVRVPPLLERILARLDAYAERWHALPRGGSLTVQW